jgi:CHAP domain
MSLTLITTILALGITPSSPDVYTGNIAVSNPQHHAGENIVHRFVSQPTIVAIDDDTEESRRMRIVEIAKSQVGLVNSRATGESDETGQKTRQGWQHLMEYFRLAAPGIWSNEVVKYKRPGLPSWCGIFALWTLKSAGINVGEWRQGVGISAVSGIKTTSNPKAGDIAYIAKNQHHAIVWKVEGDNIVTIDGNSGRQAGEITINTRPSGKFAGFYTAF